jgi:hypothetical protein
MMPTYPNGAIQQANDGLEVIDLRDNVEFASRPTRTRDAAVQMAAMERLGRAFIDGPKAILQELVNAAVDLCGADSAGISVEKEDRTDAEYYRWVATAGQYTGFLNAMLPRYPSACGITLERGNPQLFRVSQRFFDVLGVEAPLVTDGLLLPWQTEETRGTIFVMAHGRSDAFDRDDCRIMQTLANFAANGIQQMREREMRLSQAQAAAAATMANQLAHEINNPLQSLTNLVYLARGENQPEAVKALAETLSSDIDRLSVLVRKLLSLPIDAVRKQRPPAV